MQLTFSILNKISGGKAKADNVNSVLLSWTQYGSRYGLEKPHRAAHFLAQLMHESGGFFYDKELWGPTAAQKHYDNRPDLGNTPQTDGDGKLYLGRTGIQLTGKANYTRFRDWCRKEGLNPPDFVASPEMVNSDPWEGLAPMWFWTVGNSTGKSLNAYADQNNIEMITRKINGGLNGFEDRILYYEKIALAFLGLGFDKAAVEEFQKKAKAANFYDGTIDGEFGPKTRSALHRSLAALTDTKVEAGPVVQETPVPVVPKAGARPARNYWAGGAAILAPLTSVFGSLGGLDRWAQVALIVIGMLAVIFILFNIQRIASQIRAALDIADGEKAALVGQTSITVVPKGDV